MLRARLAAVAAVVLCLSVSAVHAQEAAPGDGLALEVEAGEVEVSNLIEKWAALTGRVVTIDPQVQPIRVKFTAAARLDAGVLRQVLDAHDVVMVEREGMLQAHHRRNLSQKVGPPWDLVQGLAPDDDRLVTCVVPIRHGAGNSIFATVRGLLTRDTNRIGNILFVQGPDVIILVDLAHSVRYYQEMIALLDQPPPATTRQRWRATVYEVRQAAWTRLQAAAATASARAEALRAATGDAANGVVRLAEGQFLGSEPVSVDRGVREGREHLNVSLQIGHLVRGGPPAADGKLVSADPGELHVKLIVELVNETGAMSLTLNTRLGHQRSAGPVVQSFSGRGGAEPTDIVLVLD